MEQPKYRFEDLHLQSDKDYTDINDTVVGFLIDKDVIVPFNIQRTLEDIVNNMLAGHFVETQQVLYLSDFKVSMSMEMNTRTNKIVTDTLHDYRSIKKYFFNELGCIVLGRISQLQKAAGIKGLFALL